MRADRVEYEGRGLDGINFNEISWDRTSSILLATISGKDGSLLLFDGNDLSSQVHYQLSLHTSACYCLSVDPSKRFVATAGADFLINILDATEFSTLRSIKRVDAQIHQIQFSHDGNFLAVASESPCIRIFDSKKTYLVQEI